MKIRWHFIPVAGVFLLLSSCGSCFSFDTSGDGGCSSEPPECHSPILHAIAEHVETTTGRPVVLSASANFPTEDQLTCDRYKHFLQYQWMQMTGPDALTLEGTEHREVAFVPTRAGEYIFRCRVSYPYCAEKEGACNSEWVFFTVDVVETNEDQHCDPPSAIAGSNQTIAGRQGTPVLVNLDGRGCQPDRSWGCENLNIASYEWAVLSQPAGSDVSVLNSNRSTSSVALSVPGEYVFQLTVSDSTGKTGEDAVRISLVELQPCESGLNVTIIEATSEHVVQDASVIVVDSVGDVHQASAGPDGVASFSNLAPGNRRSITASTSETVPSIPGAGGEERPRYEVTTVLDHCSDRITIPLRLTTSGVASIKRAVVTGKVPSSLFDMLPNWRDTSGPCDSDYDCCDDCKCVEMPYGKSKCVQRSLMPFYHFIGWREFVSGQFRAAIVMPVLPVRGLDSDAIASFLSSASSDTPNPPLNIATDDPFITEASDYLDRDVWKEECDYYCPDGYECVLDYKDGDKKCRDKSPLQNIRLEVPTGDEVRLVLVLGVVDGWMPAFSPIYYCFASQSCEKRDIHDVDILDVYQFKPLHLCLLSVSVAEGGETDISDALSALSLDDCWNVNYLQQEVLVPALEEHEYYHLYAEPCQSDLDCEPVGDFHKCVENQIKPGSKYCYRTYRQVKILSDDFVTILPNTNYFNPTTDNSDKRLCSWFPEYAHDMMCNIFGDCQTTTVTVPEDTECSLRRALAVASLDFPPGHPSLPEGGRVVVGFNSSSAQLAPSPEVRLPVPSLLSPGLKGAELSVDWYYYRNLKRDPIYGYRPLPGVTGVSAKYNADVDSLVMPPFLPIPSSEDIPDAGLDVKVIFLPEYPDEYGPPNVLWAYSLADSIRPPDPSVHELPGSVVNPDISQSQLICIVLSKVDREGGEVLRDSWMRIYAPQGTSNIDIFTDQVPLSSGDEVWLSLQGRSFTTPFYYNLFPIEQLLSGQSAFSEDSYALVVP